MKLTSLLEKAKVTGCIGLALLFSTQSVYAGVKKVFAVVDRIDHQKAEVVLDDQYFPLALNLKVIDVGGKQTSLYAIKTGSKLYYALKNDKVTDVWLLPAGATRPAEEPDD